MTSAAGGEQSGDTTLRADLSDPVSACGTVVIVGSLLRSPQSAAHLPCHTAEMEAAARIGLALLVLALGYVLDARAHGGARLRGDDGVGAFSDGGGMAAGTSAAF